MDPKSNDELLTNHHGGGNGGVDASGNDSPSDRVPEHGSRFVSATRQLGIEIVSVLDVYIPGTIYRRRGSVRGHTSRPGWWVPRPYPKARPHAATPVASFNSLCSPGKVRCVVFLHDYPHFLRFTVMPKTCIKQQPTLWQ